MRAGRAIERWRAWTMRAVMSAICHTHGDMRSIVIAERLEPWTMWSVVVVNLRRCRAVESVLFTKLRMVGTVGSVRSADLREPETMTSVAFASWRQAGTLGSTAPSPCGSGVAGVEAALAAELGGEEGLVILQQVERQRWLT